MFSSHWRPHALALAGYVVVALAFVWPLPLNLGTHLTGPPGGDTGVYVWNQWVFQHEILEHRHLPYFTERIFSLGRRANLSLHNYTTFQNLLALPLVGFLGVIATFNVVYLLMTVLTAYMGFLLARHVTGGVAESWLAGLVFAWSPSLVTRGMGHFSVAAAAPLAAFMLVLLRTAERERMRDAVLLGVTVWWAASTDVYFAVYCLLIAAVFLCARTVTVQRVGEVAAPPGAVGARRDAALRGGARPRHDRERRLAVQLPGSRRPCPKPQHTGPLPDRPRAPPGGVALPRAAGTRGQPARLAHVPAGDDRGGVCGGHAGARPLRRDACVLQRTASTANGRSGAAARAVSTSFPLRCPTRIIP